MRLILRTQALQARIEGRAAITDDPEDYRVIVDGPAIGRIYRNPGSNLKDAAWRWTLQAPPFGHGYTATLDEAKGRDRKTVQASGRAAVKRRKASGWQQPLTAEQRTKAGPILRTLADARAFMLDLDPGYSGRQHWQHAAALLLEASEGGDVAAATRQIYRALFLDALLWLPPRK